MLVYKAVHGCYHSVNSHVITTRHSHTLTLSGQNNLTDKVQLALKRRFWVLVWCSSTHPSEVIAGLPEDNAVRSTIIGLSVFVTSDDRTRAGLAGWSLAF